MNHSLWENPKSLAQINLFCYAKLTKLFANLLQSDESFRLPTLLEKNKVLVKYQKLMAIIVNTLTAAGYFKQESDSFIITDEFKHIVAIDFPCPPKTNKYYGIFSLLEHCLDHYQKVITGQESTLNLLFPGGENDYLYQKLYVESAPYSNAHSFPQSIGDFLNQHQHHSTHIVETGAGQGLLTWSILESLAYSPKEYLYTDISRFFLLDAAQTAKQKQYDFMSFDTVDISKAIAQKYHAKYDVVIAYNVVHATPNVQQTLEHLKSFMHDNSFLILIELCRPFFWQHIIWGLLDGWWCFNDDYRVNVPTLDAPAWQQVLHESGYEMVQNNAKITNKSDTELFIYSPKRKDGLQ